MLDNIQTDNISNYKSSFKKLATFFKKSRDQWKTKYKKVKYKLKLSTNRIRYLKSSIKVLRDEIKELKNEIRRINTQNNQLIEPKIQFEDNVNPPENALPDFFGESLLNHTYSVGHVQLYTHGGHNL